MKYPARAFLNAVFIILIAVFPLKIKALEAVGACLDCMEPHEKAVQSLTDFSCNMNSMANDCKDWFEKNPETIRFAKDCRNKSGSESESWIGACKDAGIENWSEILVLLMTSANAIEACDNSMDCKKALARDAFFVCKNKDGSSQYPCLDEVQLNDVYAGDLARKRDKVRTLALQDKEYRNKVIGAGVPLPAPGNKTGFSENLLTAVAKAKLSELGVKYSCYNGVGYAYMACYAIASLIDPTMVVGVGAVAVKGGAWATRALRGAEIQTKMMMAGGKSVRRETVDEFARSVQKQLSNSQVKMNPIAATAENTPKISEASLNPVSKRENVGVLDENIFKRLEGEPNSIPKNTDEPLKYRQLAMRDEDVQKMREISSSATIPTEKIPEALFDVYKNARLRNLPSRKQKEIEKILSSVEHADGKMFEGFWDALRKKIQVHLDEDVGKDILYHRILAHEMEHAIQDSGISRGRLIVQQYARVAFNPEALLKRAYLNELGATKAEYDFLKSLPEEAVAKITQRMKQSGQDDVAAETERIFREARTNDFYEYRQTTSPYAASDSIKNTYGVPSARQRAVVQAFFYGAAGGGVVGLKALCNQLMGLTEKDCSIYSK